jgi:predicted nuclease with TOPRIM domain
VDDCTNRIEELLKEKEHFEQKLHDGNKRSHDERITQLRDEISALQTESVSLKGLFAKKRKTEIDDKIAQLNDELKLLT